MRKNCRGCLCRTCLKTCCDRRKCPGKRKKCRKYRGFRQLSIFEMPPQYCRAPRGSWDYYGITKERYRELTAAIRSGRYALLASSAAHRANEMIAEYIILSVKEKRSYEGVEYAEGLGRIPCGRTDFYGWRRYVYHLIDLKLKEIGK